MEIEPCRPLEQGACTDDPGLCLTRIWNHCTLHSLTSSLDNTLSSSRFYFHRDDPPVGDCIDLARDESYISDGQGRECSCGQQVVDREEVGVLALFSGVGLVSFLVFGMVPS